MDLWGIWESFLDIVYPMDVRCLVCKEKRQDTLSHGVCRMCEESLPFIEPPSCPKCGKMMLADDTLCSDCARADHAFHKGLSVFEYGTEVKDLIYRYKYRGEKYLSNPMIHWMTRCLESCDWDFDVIVPVPLHPIREKQRGFNQADLLARGLSRNTGIPLMDKSLIRIRNTPQQARLSGHERRRNLMGAFRIRESGKGPGKRPRAFEGRTVLLVDDVYTTGNTADQCSRVLLGAGAGRVYIITLAIGSSL